MMFKAKSPGDVEVSHDTQGWGGKRSRVLSVVPCARDDWKRLRTLETGCGGGGYMCSSVCIAVTDPGPLLPL